MATAEERDDFKQRAGPPEFSQLEAPDEAETVYLGLPKLM